MFGGLAVAGNLLCIAFTTSRGHLYLVDLDEQRLVSHWTWEGQDGNGDAGGVSIDRDHTIWVADQRNHCVRRFSPFGRSLQVLGGDLEQSPGSVRSDRPGVLNRPRDVLVDGETVFVACGERWLRCGVQCFDRSGSVMSPLRSLGDIEGRFGAPRGLALSKAGLFVADTQHGIVQRFRRDGTFLGRIEVSTDGEHIARPVSVLADDRGSILVADDGDEPGIRHVPLDRGVRDVELPSELGTVVALAGDLHEAFYALDGDHGAVHRFVPGTDGRPQHDELIFDLEEFG
ncbi:MAG: NHL repeat-containing protein [Planctomycetota bacterium]